MRPSPRLAAIVAPSLLATAAIAFDGIALDGDGRPLARTRVAIVGLPGAAITDGEGRFAWVPDPRPPFLVLATRPDGVLLGPVPVERIEVGGDTVIRFPLTVGESVTVVTDAATDPELPPATASTALGRGDLDQRRSSRIVDALETVPGTNRSETGLAAVPSLRGLASSRTLILLDDGRVTAERRAGPSATFVDPESLEEVEVIRGPGSVAYGSDAFGGVIRLRSRLPLPGAPSQSRFVTGWGDGVDRSSVLAESSFPVDGGAVLVGAQAERFGTLDTPEGAVRNSRGETLGFRAAWQRPVAAGNLRATWRTDTAVDVGKPSSEDEIERTTYPEERSHRLGIAYEGAGPGPWSRLTVSGTWSRYGLVLRRDRTATGTEPRLVRESEVRSEDYGVRAVAERTLGVTRLSLGADLHGRYGLEAVNRTTEFELGGAPIPTVEEAAIGDARRDVQGLFAGLGVPLGRIRLAAGLRGDRVRASNSGGFFGDRSETSSALSGFAAATYLPADDLDVTLQLSRGFRDALLSDRYFRGVTGRGFVTGNPDLEPETSDQIDLAARWHRDRWRVAAFVYRYRIDDLIERFRSGDDFFFRNRGRAEIRGLELEAETSLPGGLELRLGAQRIRGEVLDAGTPTDGVPAPGAWLVVRRNPAGAWWWLARLAGFARDDRPGPTEVEVPGYAVLDVGAGVRLGSTLRADLLVRNLFDRSYPGAADERAVAAPGRSVSLTLRWRTGPEDPA